MKAKDMFEKLDFENNILTKELIGYTKIIGDRNKHITFVNCGTSKYFTVIESDRNNPTISFEELQAINQQIEELGWLE